MGASLMYEINREEKETWRLVNSAQQTGHNGGGGVALVGFYKKRRSTSSVWKSSGTFRGKQEGSWNTLARKATILVIENRLRRGSFFFGPHAPEYERTSCSRAMEIQN